MIFRNLELFMSWKQALGFTLASELCQPDSVFCVGFMGRTECDIAGHAPVLVHGLMISTPHPSKSGTLRVARAAPRDRAIAAIWASACEIGRPA